MPATRGAVQLALLLGSLLVLAACSTSDTGGTPLTPRDLLLDTAPHNFKSSVDTPLSVDAASSAISTDPNPTKAELAALGYTKGAEKVWVSGDEYVVDLDFQYNSQVGPGSTVSFVRSQLQQRASVTLFTDADVPNAQAFDLYAETRANSRQVFCRGALFPLDIYLFLVEDCASGPRYAADPLGLTRAQYEQAAKLLGLPVASPGSTPSATA